jgi:hypothetical protein
MKIKAKSPFVYSLVNTVPEHVYCWNRVTFLTKRIPLVAILKDVTLASVKPRCYFYILK